MTLLENYYTETDAVKRKKILDQMAAEGCEETNVALCQELFGLRYKEIKRGGKVAYQDRFMGLWMVMNYHKRSVTKEKALINARKEMLSVMKDLGMLKFQNESQMHKDIFYKEIENQVLLYRECCLNDSRYKRTALGLKKMKDENVENKMRVDIYKTAVEVPTCAGLEEELGAYIAAAMKVDRDFYGEEEIEGI